MPYLSDPFEHDLFVSYAHGRADRRGVKRLKHWSERLTAELEGEIVDLLPEFEKLDIYLDNQLDPAEPLTEQLRKQVSSSGLLLVIMSEHYLKSAWCEDEREWFETEVGRRGTSGGLVLVVRAQSTNHTKWPACLKDERGHVVLGFRFHPNITSNDDFVQPYGWPEPLPQDRAYYEELGKLASIITQRLRQLRRAQKLEDNAKRSRVQIRMEGRPSIYLQALHSTPEAWAEVKAMLEGAGCRVLPESLPAVGTDLSAIMAARKERLRILSNEAHAFCFLRTSKPIGIEREFEAVAGDRVALQALEKDIPFAIIDYGAEGTPRTSELNIDTINVHDVVGWLKRALGPGG